MVEKTRVRTFLVAVLAAVVLAGCGVPPLHRSVVVETNSRGMPVHASGHVANDRYTVARGDTLYSIAFRSHVDYHQLARWNGISAPYIIHPGQQLRLTRPRDLPPQAPQAPVFHTVTSTTGASSTGHAGAAGTAVDVAVATTAAGAAGAAASAPAAPVSTVVAVAGNPPVAATPQAEQSVASVPSGATRDAGGVTWRWPAGGKVLSRFDSSDAMPGITIAGNRGDPVRAAADGVVVYSGNGLVGYGELVIIKHSDDYLSAYGHNSKRLVKEGEHVKAGQLIARVGSTGAPRNELEFQVRYKGKPVNPLNYLPKR
ncbi:MAG TPA: peptidoglycan DD-metalloendopeptidase family protein [Oleiagrimonas sp.]|nr:peptidoglycan DD-metalloendopeptidase family protein [Oleiagrimonas sp.]